MHEVSIALNLIGIASDQCKKHGCSIIESVNIRVGRASGVMSDALLFAFDAIKEGPVAGNAVLNIEEIPVSGHCGDCGSNFTTEEEYVLC